LANTRIRKIVDHRLSYGIAYTMHAAINRNRRYIDSVFFMYGLMRATSDYVVNFFGTERVNNACIELLSYISEDDGDEQSGSIVEGLSGLVISKEVSSCIELVRTGKTNIGLLGVMASMYCNNTEVACALQSVGIELVEVEKAAAQEIGIMNPPAKNTPPAIPGNIPMSNIPPPAQAPSPLSDLCIDMTELAANGDLNRTFCRDVEIDGVVLSLMRKIKNNPLLIGEPGVGKTAIVEGLAYRIVSGEVPYKLQGAKLLSLEMSTLVSGTNLRGQFEERLKSVIETVCADDNAILFIDEIHMLVGAGDNTGVMDAGNMLKPYLARGELRCVGATTFRDYNRTIKKDGALSRRFHKITVQEVGKEPTLDILEGLKPDFERFHGCKISKKALVTIVDLSARYLTERNFPDKAIDCMDDACARAVMMGKMVSVARVEETVASLANVPISMIRSSDEERVSEVRPMLKSEILGNDNAIDSVCDLLLSGFTNSKHDGGVLCSMLLHGPKGVGKSTILHRISASIFGSDALLEINGSEYSEQHSISKVIGSPPGYVGYNEESKIVRQVRKCPHSLIVIDGIVNMHSVVREQIFEMVRSGKMTTGEGDIVDLSNAIFVFLDTSSASRAVGFSSESSDSLAKGLDHWRSYGIFSDIDSVIEFKPIVSSEILRNIIEMELNNRTKKIEAKTSEEIVERVLDENTGASPSKLRKETRRAIDALDLDGTVAGEDQ